MATFWWILGVSTAAALAVPLARRWRREVHAGRAVELFRLKRERLEELFVVLQPTDGDAAWLFSSTVRYFEVNRPTAAPPALRAKVVALVEVDHAGRSAAAVFLYDHGQWGTDGVLLPSLGAHDAGLYANHWTPLAE
ncbi:MAG: hypothetical protein ACRC1K_01290 [Planctomycetia bacterium]